MAPSIRFDRIASRYDATRGGDARGQHTAAAIAPWLPPGPVIELGVGTGVVGAALAAQGRTVVGVDLARPMLVEAAARMPGCVAQGDLLAPPFQRGSAAAEVEPAIAALRALPDPERPRPVWIEWRYLVLEAAVGGET